MNIPSLFLRAHLRCSQNSSLTPYILTTFSKQRYATHHQTVNEGPSDLSQSLDTRQSRSGSSHESVGPFQLGLSQRARQGEKVKKWSELSTGGKVVRTTARTTNLTVILLGAGLSAILLYSLTSELFSKNSPTVLYGQACELIKSSPQVAKYLNSPLTFYNNPPSLVRPRHRNRHIISQVMVDSYGNEHMIMTFYVQGQEEGFKVVDTEASYQETVNHWVQEKIHTLAEMSLDDVVAWSKESTNALWEQGKRAFKYLAGSPVPPIQMPSTPMDEAMESKRNQDNSTWSFAGMFSSLKSSRTTPTEIKSRPDGRSFTEGEVHADFIMNKDGYFTARYILIDIPSSRDKNPTRVFVERAPGVRENEPVMRWNT